MVRGHGGQDSSGSKARSWIPLFDTEAINDRESLFVYVAVEEDFRCDRDIDPWSLTGPGLLPYCRQLRSLSIPVRLTSKALLVSLP